MLDDRVGVWKTHCRFILCGNIGHKLTDIKNFAKFARLCRIVNTGDDHVIGVGKGPGIRLLKDCETRRPCSRLEDSDKTLASVFSTQCFERFLDGGRVMGKIVDYGHASLDTPDLDAAL